MTKEQLIRQIMKECEKEGEPVTVEEATEMAEMEMKANADRRYEKSDTPRKTAKKERKIDEKKKKILNCCRVLVEGLGAKVTDVKTETEITFQFEDEVYSLKLIKHRKKEN